MQNLFEKYIQDISSKYSHEETSEIGYRTDFEDLLKGIFAKIHVKRIDHDAKAVEGNKPDFVVFKEVPILYVEAKDIGVSLDKIEKSNQMARYFGYANLVLTDYLEFRFYRNGSPYGKPIKIAEYDKKSREITPNPANYDYLSKTLIDFAQSHKEPIKSGLHLAKIMGGKAQRIRDNVREILSSEAENADKTELQKIYDIIKRLLVHDLDIDRFSDMYAQTLVYGLFVARYYDETPKTFTRQEARDLIPGSNPFLQHFFDHIVGPTFVKRLEYIVDELCEVYSHADLQELMKDYYKKDTQAETLKEYDPVKHFYEDFLKEYDPVLRKKMAAYYTPLPVVNFIVRSVDYLLKKEFKLSGGLADTTKIDGKTHKVQILDPAVGTGTFIGSIINHIYANFKKTGQSGRWPTYVHNDLLPRLHGFELMMAPYTIAHLKLSMAFKQTGFKHFNRRLGIYLTNSLEEGAIQNDLFTGLGFAESIAEESKQAAKIKNETPVMVVIGNPPYSVSSQNKGEWIQDLIKVYKEGLNERKLNLDDDYIKFIRFAEQLIEKNGSGIVAMITNNSYIDGITHRQMRKHLMETFDDIYVLDLHGNSNKKENAPDGSKDENVFDIQQGVCISILVRINNKKKGLGSVHHSEIYGLRERKFNLLSSINLQTIKWKRVKFKEPSFFFIPKDFGSISEYENGFGVNDLMPLHISGIQTKNDLLSISYSKEDLDKVLHDFRFLSLDDLKKKYPRKESSGWNYGSAQKDLGHEYKIVPYQYRPFDYRWLCYTGRSGGFIGRPRNQVMQHFLHPNVGYAFMPQFFQDIHYNHIIVTDKMVDERTLYSNRGGTYLCPLYVYSSDGSRTPNFNQGILDKIGKVVDKSLPEDIFDYIYAVLHSPSYREKYKEFLKIDFPRIPYPKDKKIFKQLVKLGTELRLLHLLESPKLDKFITTYPQSGSDTVEKLEYKDGKVYINPDQYFGKVPDVAWNFYIGGYQPAQKWLKDRKGRTLTNEDIEHYQKIIVALVETDKLMKKIDGVVPKWPMK